MGKCAILLGHNKRPDLGVVTVLAGIFFCCHAVATLLSGHAVPAEGERVAAKGEARSAGEWRAIEASRFEILCRPDADLRAIERQLRSRTSFFSSRPTGTGATAAEKIAYHANYLFGRVEELLDMRPAMPKITIKIFRDQEELETHYFFIFKKRADPKSFYVHTFRTIYVSEDDISDSVLAHEMAHAVIDHYFAHVPPEKVAEVLASYVDMHLEDDE